MNRPNIDYRQVGVIPEDEDPIPADAIMTIEALEAACWDIIKSDPWMAECPPDEFIKMQAHHRQHPRGFYSAHLYYEITDKEERHEVKFTRGEPVTIRSIKLPLSRKTLDDITEQLKRTR